MYCKCDEMMPPSGVNICSYRTDVFDISVATAQMCLISVATAQMCLTSVRIWLRSLHVYNFPRRMMPVAGLNSGIL